MHLPTARLLGSELDYRELKRTLIVGVTNLTMARPEAFYTFPPDDAGFERDFVGLLGYRVSRNSRFTVEDVVQHVPATTIADKCQPGISSRR